MENARRGRLRSREEDRSKEEKNRDTRLGGLPCRQEGNLERKGEGRDVLFRKTPLPETDDGEGRAHPPSARRRKEKKVKTRSGRGRGQKLLSLRLRVPEKKPCSTNSSQKKKENSPEKRGSYRTSELSERCLLSKRRGRNINREREKTTTR